MVCISRCGGGWNAMEVISSAALCTVLCEVYSRYSSISQLTGGIITSLSQPQYWTSPPLMPDLVNMTPVPQIGTTAPHPAQPSSALEPWAGQGGILDTDYRITLNNRYLEWANPSVHLVPNKKMYCMASMEIFCCMDSMEILCCMDVHFIGWSI